MRVDSALQFEVTRCLAEYADCINTDRLEQWPEFFTNDCLYMVQSRENFDRDLPLSAIRCDSKGMLVDRIVSLRNANIYAEHFYRHILSIPLIKSLSDEEIIVHTNYVVYQTLLDGASRPYNVGRYLDKMVRVNGELKFKEKIAVFDTNQISTLLVTPI